MTDSAVPSGKPEDEHSRFLREFLTGHDVDCPQCGYNLRDLTTDICPECGERITIGVRLVEPRQAAPLAGLIGLASGGGFNLLLLVYALIMSVRHGLPGGFLARFMIVNSLSLIVMAGLTFMWLRWWRHIRATDGYKRWSLATVCWITAVVDIVIFTFAIN